MKSRFLRNGILLMITMTVLNTTPAFAGSGNGCLDSIEGSTISGWAWNSEDPSASVEVTVTIANQATGEVVKELYATTSIHRNDLDAAVYGDRNHGFSVIVDWAGLGDGIYRVSAAAGGVALPNSLRYNVGDVDEAAGARSLGVFRTTAYCPCRSCSEGWGRRTSSGALATAEHTVAVDPRVIPMGSRLLIDGVIYTAQDVGGGVKGNHVDIYFNTHAQTRQYGSRSAEVFLLP